MEYEIVFSDKAVLDSLKLQQSEPKAFEKLMKLVEELKTHPTTGTGKPERLRGNLSGKWSRRITERHRLVYEIHEFKITVNILSAYRHYDDK